MAWLRPRPVEPRFKLSASELARELALMGAEKRRQAYAERLRGTTALLRAGIAAGVVSPIAPTEGWR